MGFGTLFRERSRSTRPLERFRRQSGSRAGARRGLSISQSTEAPMRSNVNGSFPMLLRDRVERYADTDNFAEHILLSACLLFMVEGTTPTQKCGEVSCSRRLAHCSMKVLETRQRPLINGSTV